MMEERNPALGAQMKKAVRKQIRSNDPPVTKETCNRLLSEGIEENEVIRLIACVLANEMHAIMKLERPFDVDDYAKMLAKLPVLPWE